MHFFFCEDFPQQSVPMYKILVIRTGNEDFPPPSEPMCKILAVRNEDFPLSSEPMCTVLAVRNHEDFPLPLVVGSPSEPMFQILAYT